MKAGGRESGDWENSAWDALFGYLSVQEYGWWQPRLPERFQFEYEYSLSTARIICRNGFLTSPRLAVVASADGSSIVSVPSHATGLSMAVTGFDFSYPQRKLPHLNSV